MKPRAPIVLIDQAPPFQRFERELGLPCEHLLTPLTRRRYRGGMFAVDNGAFAGFQESRFVGLLERLRPHRDRCRFVVVPDIVGSAQRTSELFEGWTYRLGSWPQAYVAQDGIERATVPWERIECLFVGGTDRFKLSRAADDVALTAHLLGKWVHVGRVNTPERFAHWREHADSIDSSGIARFSHMRRALTGGLALFDRVRP